MNEHFREGINQFVKKTYELGMLDNDELKGMVICVNRIEGEYCDIAALPADDSAINNYDVHFGFPKLPEQEIDAMIDLAGFLSTKLKTYLDGRKGADISHASLTPDQRKVRAKKAAAARWKNKKQ